MAKRSWLRALLLAVMLLALGACAQPATPAPDGGDGGDGGDAPPAAVSGELNVLCTPQVEWCEGMKAEFEAAYPDITVNFIRVSSGEALTRLRNERENPQFDIWWGGPVDSFIAAKEEGLLQAYDSPNLANLTNQQLYKDAENFWAGVYMGSLGFATNTNFLAENPGLEPPNSWDDLLAPEWQGQLLMAHPSSSGTSYTALCTILQIRGEEAGWEYIRSFNQNVLQYTRSGAAPARFVGTGEAAVGIVFSHDIVAAIEEGMPLTLSFPEEGTGYEIGGMAILAGAKNLDAAKLWFDWALEPETQELGPQYKAYQAPTVEGAEPSRPELLEVELIDYDFADCGAIKTEVVDRFTNEVAGADDLKE